MKNYSLSDACIDIIKTSKNTDEANERLAKEIMANAVFLPIEIAYNEIKQFYNNNIIEPREDIKKLVHENEIRNRLFAQQVRNQNELILGLRAKGII